MSWKAFKLNKNGFSFVLLIASQITEENLGIFRLRKLIKFLQEYTYQI